MRMLRLILAGMVIPVLLGGLPMAAAQEEPMARPPMPSAGCGGSDVGPGAHRDLTITVEDLEREWQMHVPEGYDPQTPMPLWIGLHGRGQAPLNQIWYTKQHAEEQGFVVVAPQRDHFDQDHWMWDTNDAVIDVSLDNPDIALVESLIDRVGDELCLDLARVYATGFSSGGGGVTVLACALEDRIAATAAVSGLTYDLGDACELDRPVPFLAIHGTADSGPFFDGGYAISHPIKELYGSASIPDRVAAIARRNGCEDEPTSEDVGETVDRLTWSCPVDADVELIVIDGGRHDWPTRYSRHGLDATETVWDFFEQHPMPAEQPDRAA